MELIFLLTIAILSMIVIIKASGYAIDAISRYAKTEGISDYLIAFLVVSIGTSLPELTTAIFSSIAQVGQLSVGNVLGANVLVITLILGVVALFGKNIKIEEKIMNRTIFTVIFIALFVLVLGLDGNLSRLDGVLLIIGFIFYASFIWRREQSLGRMRKQVSWREIIRDMAIFIGSLIALLLAARWFVFSAVNIAQGLNISIFFMGLVFISIGTTLPELTVCIRSVLRKHKNIAFGDIFGAITTNILLVLGIAALIHPITFARTRFILSAFYMLFAISVGVILLKKGTLTWKHGILLLSLYVLFILLEVLI